MFVKNKQKIFYLIFYFKLYLKITLNYLSKNEIVWQ